MNGSVVIFYKIVPSVMKYKVLILETDYITDLLMLMWWRFCHSANCRTKSFYINTITNRCEEKIPKLAIIRLPSWCLILMELSHQTSRWRSHEGQLKVTLRSAISKLKWRIDEVCLDLFGFHLSVLEILNETSQHWLRCQYKIAGIRSQRIK